ncbi:hypothetical protein INR49_021666 [Caranx melampygus]|nr:hypothetical protein INR49_021666 [Caranx melampygus]
MTVFHTSGSSLPAICCRHLPLECILQSAAPEPCPDLSPFLSRSSVPLHKRSPPALNLLSAPSQLHSPPAALSKKPVWEPSEGRRPSSSSCAWFCLWSRRRAIVSLLMSPSTVRPRGGPRRESFTGDASEVRRHTPNPEEEETCTSATEGAQEKSLEALTLTLPKLEEVLYSAPRSCRHGDEVWPNLYLGDMFGLWQLGITHVLNASHGKLCCKGSDDFYGTTVKYYGVPANDLPTFDLSPFFYPAAAFIHQALTSGGKVFVHCAVGVSRSAALVLAYLMIHHHLSLLSSIRCVQEKRWIFPNRGFLRQLMALDRQLQENGLNEPK